MSMALAYANLIVERKQCKEKFKSIEKEGGVVGETKRSKKKKKKKIHPTIVISSPVEAARDREEMKRRSSASTGQITKLLFRLLCGIKI
ncbi:hypothetical protein KFK09_024854 [Dendrobium nobile]|uniref:Uncharacterized protein n=1 Tax=Dendrobium nobile TaxID=94219 RepID=A0A8T3AF73_DENNO|nr:hypothetical protein KFK09_024854 [Dendrobium nobile]